MLKILRIGKVKELFASPSLMGTHLDRSQSLFYFVPQEKGLIWRPPWGWKNMGESILHWEDGSPLTRKRPNGYKHMPEAQGSLSEPFFVHYPSRSSHF